MDVFDGGSGAQWAFQTTPNALCHSRECMLSQPRKWGRPSRPGMQRRDRTIPGAVGDFGGGDVTGSGLPGQGPLVFCSCPRPAFGTEGAHGTGYYLLLFYGARVDGPRSLDLGLFNAIP